MAEDFTTYTETDPNSRITVTSTKVEWAGVQRDEDARVYKDYGASHFTGDFTHDFEIYLNSTTESSGFIDAYVLANAVDDHAGLRTASESYLLTALFEAAGPVYSIRLREGYLGTDYEDFYNASGDTLYYVTKDRASSTLTLEIYTDASRTTLVDTLSLTLNATPAFRYLYACNSFNGGTTEASYGYTQNLDLNEAGGTTILPLLNAYHG